MARVNATPRASPAVTSLLDYRALADLRYQIRRFLRVRELAARAAGVEPQQYLTLLQIKGLEGHEVATMSVLAERTWSSGVGTVVIGAKSSCVCGLEARRCSGASPVIRSLN
jgi:hypothetical protein